MVNPVDRTGFDAPLVLTDLPEEILVDIMGRLEVPDLGRVAQTSHAMQRISEDNGVWRQIAARQGILHEDAQGVCAVKKTCKEVMDPLSAYKKEKHITELKALSEVLQAEELEGEQDSFRKDVLFLFNEIIAVCDLPAEQIGELNKPTDPCIFDRLSDRDSHRRQGSLSFRLYVIVQNMLASSEVHQLLEAHPDLRTELFHFLRSTTTEELSGAFLEFCWGYPTRSEPLIKKIDRLLR